MQPRTGPDITACDYGCFPPMAGRVWASHETDRAALRGLVRVAMNVEDEAEEALVTAAQPLTND